MIILPFTLSFARIAMIINPTNATTGGAICAIASFALPALVKKHLNAEWL